MYGIFKHGLQCPHGLPLPATKSAAGQRWSFGYWLALTCCLVSVCPLGLSAQSPTSQRSTADAEADPDRSNGASAAAYANVPPADNVPPEVTVPPEDNVPTAANRDGQIARDAKGPQDNLGQRENRLRFSFNGARWREVLEWLAEEGELALQLGELPTGSFTYSDRENFTLSGAISRLNLFLIPEGFAAVRRGNLLTVIQLGDPRSLQQLDALAQVVPPESLDERDANEVG